MDAAGLVVMIGALTPLEIVQARSWGADVVKIFPGSLVGPGYIKVLRGPFPDNESIWHWVLNYLFSKLLHFIIR